MANIKRSLIALVGDNGQVKPLVIMLDAPVHTPENGYRCTDATCPCWADFTEVDEAHERMMRAPLGHNGKPFNLMR